MQSFGIERMSGLCDIDQAETPKMTIVLAAFFDFKEVGYR